jgi:hypothetical protein
MTFRKRCEEGANYISSILGNNCFDRSSNVRTRYDSITLYSYSRLESRVQHLVSQQPHCIDLLVQRGRKMTRRPLCRRHALLMVRMRTMTTTTARTWRAKAGAEGGEELKRRLRVARPSFRTLRRTQKMIALTALRPTHLAVTECRLVRFVGVVPRVLVDSALQPAAVDERRRRGEERH